MAKSGLTTRLLLEQAGVLLLTAQSVQKFAASRRRAESGEPAGQEPSIVERCDDLGAVQSAFLQYLHLESQYPSEAGQYALFYTAAAIRHMLYELEHELLNLPEPHLMAEEIDKLRKIGTAWTTNPAADMENGILDAWNVEQSIDLIQTIRLRFS